MIKDILFIIIIGTVTIKASYDAIIAIINYYKEKKNEKIVHPNHFIYNPNKIDYANRKYEYLGKPNKTEICGHGNKGRKIRNRRKK